MRQPLGRGRGSKPALYSGQQQLLFHVLLNQRRAGMSVSGLARFPVAYWLYFPATRVTGAQALEAFRTWLGDPRASRDAARRNALALTDQLARGGVSRAVRRRLTNLMEKVAYDGTIADELELRANVEGVFDGDFGGVARSVGHPSAPLTAEAVIDIIRANVAGATATTRFAVTSDDFEAAGAMQRLSLAEYVRDFPELAEVRWGQPAGFYPEPTVTWLIEDCCDQMLTALGLRQLERGSSPTLDGSGASKSGRH